jgi:hypothetical protein
MQVEPVAYSTSNPAAYPRLKLVCSLPVVETIRVVAKNIGITPSNYADVTLSCFCDANHILFPDGSTVSHNFQAGTIADDTFLHSKIVHEAQGCPITSYTISGNPPSISLVQATVKGELKPTLRIDGTSV